MSREIEIWKFIAERIKRGEQCVLLVVAESHGSSPGRAGYKMAVAEDELIGSIGGGVMEVNLVEQARETLSLSPGVSESTTRLIEQEHRKNSDHPSGMICSGRQIVLCRVLGPAELESVEAAAHSAGRSRLVLNRRGFHVQPAETTGSKISFARESETYFEYREAIGHKNELIIIGGGHCALALSEIMSKLDFSIRIFDDRPELNTLEKNQFADEITIVGSYEDITGHVAEGEDNYVVVMTLGYRTDAIVIRRLLGRRFKYFGVLGSKAKMATLMRELRSEGFTQEQLADVHTPIGLPIHSHSPEEIAVSIAAEIISVKNA